VYVCICVLDFRALRLIVYYRSSVPWQAASTSADSLGAFADNTIGPSLVKATSSSILTPSPWKCLG